MPKTANRATRWTGRRASGSRSTPVLASPVRHPYTRWIASRSTLTVALVAAVLLVYAPALTLGFINFDDPQYVLDNAHVRSGLTANGIGWAMLSAKP